MRAFGEVDFGFVVAGGEGRVTNGEWCIVGVGLAALGAASAVGKAVEVIFARTATKPVVDASGMLGFGFDPLGDAIRRARSVDLMLDDPCQHMGELEGGNHKHKYRNDDNESTEDRHKPGWSSKRQRCQCDGARDDKDRTEYAH